MTFGRESLRRALGIAVLAAFVLTAQAGAANKSKDAAKTASKAGTPGTPGADAAAGDKPYGDWKKVTKDAEVQHGYLTLYKKRENLYLELRPEQFGQPVLGVFSFGRGIGSNFLLGGLPLGDHLLEFQRAGDHVLVLEKNTRFLASGDTAFARALDLSYGNSVLASLKIESVQDSTKAVLVDLAPFLVSDLTDLAEGIHGAVGKAMRFDKDRSALGTVKDFTENTEIEALLTYSPTDRQNYGLNTVPDDRYVPITAHYSFSKLPDHPMTPRLADDRTGYFLTAMKDYNRDTDDNYWRRYINRWRLEKKDPAAAMSEPRAWPRSCGSSSPAACCAAPYTMPSGTRWDSPRPSPTWSPTAPSRRSASSGWRSTPRPPTTDDTAPSASCESPPRPALSPP